MENSRVVLIMKLGEGHRAGAGGGGGLPVCILSLLFSSAPCSLEVLGFLRTQFGNH